MVSDSVAERERLYQEGLDELAPQIRGLQDKVNDSLSSELKAALTARLGFLNDRKTKIEKAVNLQNQADAAAQVLDDDGFPNLPPMQIEENLIEEYDREVTDDQAARGGFEAKPQASQVVINLGTPVTKP